MSCFKCLQSPWSKNKEDEQIKQTGISTEKDGKTVIIQNQTINNTFINITLNEKNQEDLNYQNNDDVILLPEQYIREEEKGFIKYSKKGILSFVDKIRHDNEYPWTKICNIDNTLIIDYKNGNFITQDFYLIRITYKFQKKIFIKPITINEIVKNLYDRDLRMKFDKSLKNYQIFEQSENYMVYRNYLYSPIFFVSERDVVDKRIAFYENNNFHSFASAMDNSYFPEQEGVVRCKTYLNSINIFEKDDHFYLESYMQYDVRSFVPEKIINFTIPSKNQEWFNNFTNHLNEYLKERDY